MTHRTDRRTVLTGLAAGAAAAALPALPRAAAAAAEGSCGPATAIPNVLVQCHDGSRALFYNDLVRGKSVLIHFAADPVDPDDAVLANLARVQEALGERLGRDVFLYSIVSAAGHAGPPALARLAERCGARPGWLFLTAEPAALELLRGSLFAHAGGHASHAHAGPPAEDCSRGLLRYGNDAIGLWGAVPAKTEPQWIAERIAWVSPGTAAQASAAALPRRRGPRPLRGSSLLALACALLAGLAARSLDAQGCACQPASAPPCPAAVQHPHMQCPIATSCATTSGATTTVCTGESLFPKSAPFLDPPGTNFLPSVYTDIIDVNGHAIPNTLPSTPTIPYNLHDGVPVVSEINHTSPTDDLESIFKTMGQAPANDSEELLIQRALKMGIDVLEGNPIYNRAYSGIPLLHFDGPDKLRKVTPVLDAAGKMIGGEVHVHQVWYDQHIESDTALVDPTAVADVPWTMIYTVDVLNRGKDDFSPFVMYFNGGGMMPGVAMDQTFFPMPDGTRTVFRIKMAPGSYYNLTYTWGWRVHPPRAQVIENATKRACVTPPPPGGQCPTLVDWEVAVFGAAPRASEQAKLAAIAKIGDLDPAKRMWRALRAARDAVAKKDWARVVALAKDGHDAFLEWRNRTKLPSGVKPDPDADLTLLYVNNTLYGQFFDGGVFNFPRWEERGTELKVTVYNGDYFEHGYQNVDFGGARGWENQFKSSVKVGGSGCWFTFGRVYWWMNLPNSPSAPPGSPSAPPYVFTVPAAKPGAAGKPDTPGVHKFHITFNYDPSRRLRFYQFDPLHHDVAIYSVH